MLTFFVACIRNEVHVSFTLTGVGQEAFRIDYYASDNKKGWLIEEFVNVQKGAGSTILRTVNPTLVYLSRMSDNGPMAVFYASRGDDIKITGNSTDPLTWKISGNEVSDELTSWRLSVSEALLLCRKDPAKGKSKVNALVAKYVKANPSNPAAAIILYCYYDRRGDERGFDSLTRLLKDKAAEPRWSTIVSRADMISDAPAPDRMPSRILLKTPAGCDTLSAGKAPMFIYFNHSGSKRYDKDIDVLRALSRDFKDSSSRIICDISFDKDSSSRVYRIRRDSLRNTIRAWMPLGISDSTARALGVRRAPFIIVADKKGSSRYRGADINLADSLFRSLMSQ